MLVYKFDLQRKCVSLTHLKVHNQNHLQIKTKVWKIFTRFSVKDREILTFMAFEIFDAFMND